MNQVARIAVRERRAAEMLDLPVKEFRELVRAGHLPKSRRIGDYEVWSVATLSAVIDGSAMQEPEFEP